MLPSALESAGWGNERCGIKRPPGGRGMMRAGDRSISRQLGRVDRGLRRRERKGRRRRRSRRVGGVWTVELSNDVPAILVSRREDRLQSTWRRQAQNLPIYRRRTGRFLSSTCNWHSLSACCHSLLPQGGTTYRFLPFRVPQCLDRVMMWGYLVDAIAYRVSHARCQWLSALLTPVVLLRV